MSLLTETQILERCMVPVKINEYPEAFNDPLAIDVEHDESGNWVGVGIYDGSAYYFTDKPGTSDYLNYLLKGHRIIAHNGVSDFKLLRQWGINVLDSQLYWDTYLMAHILDSSLKTYGLKAVAKRELGVEWPEYSDIVGKPKAKVRKTLDQWPVEVVARYNACDTSHTYELYKKQLVHAVMPAWKGISIAGEYFDSLEKPVSVVFDAMETRGVRIDVPYLEELKTKLEAEQAPIKQEIINELGEINLNSPKQLLAALNAKGIFPKLKNKPSTDKRAIERYKNAPVVSRLLEYSEFDTLLSSFIRPYVQRNVSLVHCFFNQCGTRTGRPSCSNPNLLQIPRRTENGKLVRRMFIPREGMVFGDCDYGQIEPRVLAHLSKDQNLCSLFNEGVDFHQYTAERLGVTREVAKVLNLSVGYRATHKSVSAQLKCSEMEAQNEIGKWWGLFPGLRRWQDTLIYETKRSGHCTTLLGRRIKVDGLNDPQSWKRESSERQLINNITQGSAAEIMKKAMINIHGHKDLSPTFGLLVQVYDSLLWESQHAFNDAQVVCNEMRDAVKLDVPLTVDLKIGPNWGEVLEVA